MCLTYAQISWWRHQMETFSALLAICAGNSPATGEFPKQRLVTRSFDVFLDLRLNKRLVNNREAVDLRCHGAHYDVIVMINVLKSEPQLTSRRKLRLHQVEKGNKSLYRSSWAPGTLDTSWQAYADRYNEIAPIATADNGGSPVVWWYWKINLIVMGPSTWYLTFMIPNYEYIPWIANDLPRYYTRSNQLWFACGNKLHITTFQSKCDNRTNYKYETPIKCIMFATCRS